MPFTSEIADDIEARALVYALDIVDIYSNSWGPSYDKNHLGEAGPLMIRALELGVTMVSVKNTLMFIII